MLLHLKREKPEPLFAEALAATLKYYTEVEKSDEADMIDDHSRTLSRRIEQVPLLLYTREYSPIYMRAQTMLSNPSRDANELRRYIETSLYTDDKNDVNGRN